MHERTLAGHQRSAAVEAHVGRVDHLGGRSGRRDTDGQRHVRGCCTLHARRGSRPSRLQADPAAAFRAQRGSQASRLSQTGCAGSAHQAECRGRPSWSGAASAAMRRRTSAAGRSPACLNGGGLEGRTEAAHSWAAARGRTEPGAHASTPCDPPGCRTSRGLAAALGGFEPQAVLVDQSHHGHSGLEDRLQQPADDVKAPAEGGWRGEQVLSEAWVRWNQRSFSTKRGSLPTLPAASHAPLVRRRVERLGGQQCRQPLLLVLGDLGPAAPGGAVGHRGRRPQRGGGSHGGGRRDGRLLAEQAAHDVCGVGGGLQARRGGRQTKGERGRRRPTQKHERAVASRRRRRWAGRGRGASCPQLGRPSGPAQGQGSDQGPGLARRPALTGPPLTDAPWLALGSPSFCLMPGRAVCRGGECRRTTEERA